MSTSWWIGTGLAAVSATAGVAGVWTQRWQRRADLTLAGVARIDAKSIRVAVENAGKGHARHARVRLARSAAPEQLIASDWLGAVGPGARAQLDLPLSRLQESDGAVVVIFVWDDSRRSHRKVSRRTLGEVEAATAGSLPPPSPGRAFIYDRHEDVVLVGRVA